jgi:hypothetical protein
MRLSATWGRSGGQLVREWVCDQCGEREPAMELAEPG